MWGSGSIEGDDLFTPVIEPEKLLPAEERGRRQKVIVIAGPTCCDKTALSIMLAKALGGEVISVDAMQVYQGMDIGTAKATLEQQTVVPHHMIDVCPPDRSYSVVDYFYASRHVCETILAQNKVPIAAGGAGFYLHVFLYGPPQGPQSVPEVRKALERELEKYGVETMYERLQELDPKYAEKVTHHDRHKIIRALEIMTLTKRAVSSISWGENKQPIDYDFRCWFIHRPRDILYRRIEARCDAMIEQGLLDEVIDMEKKGLRNNPSAAQAIGYRQALAYLDSEQTPADYEEFVHSFKKASRRYAKRQFTWFRKEKAFRWLDVELHDLETAADMILNDWEKK